MAVDPKVYYLGKVGLKMEEVVKQIYSPSKKYRAQIIKRNDGCGEEFWSPVSTGFSLIGSKDSAEVVAIEQLRNHSLERIE